MEIYHNIEEVLKQKNIKFLRDQSGNNPLSYAILIRSYESMNLLIKYMIFDNPQSISKMKSQELINLYK